MQGAGVPDRTRRWAREAVFGLARHRGRIDHLLSLHVRGGLDGLDDPVLDVLRLGAYQLVFMDGVPDYAAISQAVEQVREVGHPRAAGLVNGVLRSLVRSGWGPERFPNPDVDPPGNLSTWGSHPRWLVDRWLSRWTPDEVARLVEWDNRVPPVAVTWVGGPPDALAMERARNALTGAGVGIAGALEEAGSLVLEDPRTLDSALASGPFQVQDPAAALVAAFAGWDPEAAERNEVPDQTGHRKEVPGEANWWVDLCAAPGGKSMALAARGYDVLAADRSRSRLGRVRENARRLGLPVHPVVARAQDPPIREVARILLDVPCSGTGTLRRHPDARWRLRPSDIATLEGLQADMLAAAAARIRPGGLLVYSTCTLEPEENEGQIGRFLQEHPEFRLEVPGEPWNAEPLQAFVNSDGFLVVLPQEHGFDGAFAARLRREG